MQRTDTRYMGSFEGYHISVTGNVDTCSIKIIEICLSQRFHYMLLPLKSTYISS